MIYHSEEYEPSLRRVIFKLDNGARVYASGSNGSTLEWELCEIRSLKENIECFGSPCLTTDLKYYEVNFCEFHDRHGNVPFLRVTGIATEAADKPVTKEWLVENYLQNHPDKNRQSQIDTSCRH